MNKCISTLIIFACCWQYVGGQSILEVKKPSVTLQTHVNDITGILGAFGEEIKLLLAEVKHTKVSVFQAITFTEGDLKGEHVVIAQTGIGKVNAALTTILLIEHFHPKRILFTGIAGAVNPTLAPGDIVIGLTVAHHDFGTLKPDGITRTPTRDPNTMQENPVYFPGDSILISLARKASNVVTLDSVQSAKGRRRPAIVAGVIVTGDVFVSSKPATLELFNNMRAEATEMEGAAVAQVCYQQRIPFLVIRSMSDNAGEDAATDVAAFYQIAAHNSARFIMAILENSVHGRKKRH
jgi:adenosylhomocysteine nucleosidase